MHGLKKIAIPRNSALNSHHQSGVSLIESLIALFVLALGILGIAGLQARSVVEARLSNARSAAVLMAADIQERMKLNARARTDSINAGTTNPYIINFGAPPTARNCLTDTCSPAELATFDLSQWKITLGAMLPGGDGNVFQMPNDPGAFGVLISWTAGTEQGKSNDFRQPFQINTNVPGVNCPANQICHLVRIRP